MTTDQLIIEKFLENNTDATISIIEKLEIEEITILVEDLPPDKSAIILASLFPFRAGKIIDAINTDKCTKLMHFLSNGEMELILRQVPESISRGILDHLPDKRARHLKSILKYPQDSIGAHIEPVVFTLSADLEIEEGLNMVKQNFAEVKSKIFVLDRQKILVGYVEIIDLISSEPKNQIRSIIKASPKSFPADMRVHDLAEHWDDKFIELPVVNTGGNFLGVISRAVLVEENQAKKKTYNDSAIKASHALGDLYLIGLTSLIGNLSETRHKIN